MNKWIPTYSLKDSLPSHNIIPIRTSSSFIPGVLYYTHAILSSTLNPVEPSPSVSQRPKCQSTWLHLTGQNEDKTWWIYFIMWYKSSLIKKCKQHSNLSPQTIDVLSGKRLCLYRPIVLFWWLMCWLALCQLDTALLERREPQSRKWPISCRQA